MTSCEDDMSPFLRRSLNILCLNCVQSVSDSLYTVQRVYIDVHDPKHSSMVGNVTCSAYPLEYLDTIHSETGDLQTKSALNLIGTPRVFALNLRGAWLNYNFNLSGTHRNLLSTSLRHVCLPSTSVVHDYILTSTSTVRHRNLLSTSLVRHVCLPSTNVGKREV